jgi:hypothetical protein
MPAPDSKLALHVYGACTCPNPGYTLTLTYKEPQGINPKDLLLDLTAEAPSGPVPDVLWPCTVEYTQETTMEYDTVTILGEGGGSVKVEHPQ